MSEAANSGSDMLSAEIAMVETEKLVSILFDKLEGWITGFVQMLPNLVVATLVVMGAALVAKIAASLLRRATARATHNEQIASLVSTVGRIGVIAAGVFVALGLLNLDKTVTSLLAGVGVVGLALGFAFQDIASNFMSGVIMAVRRPFATGDLVETHATLGRVKKLSLRSTLLESLDGNLIIIPNKEVLQNKIVNYTASPDRRVSLPVGVGYGTALAEAKAVATRAIEELEHRNTSKDVQVLFTGFGGSSIDMELRFWLNSAEQSEYLERRSEAIMAVKAAFDEAGIEIPFPIRTLEFGSDGVRQLGRALRGGEDVSSEDRAA